MSVFVQTVSVERKCVGGMKLSRALASVEFHASVLGLAITKSNESAYCGTVTVRFVVDTDLTPQDVGNRSVKRQFGYWARQQILNRDVRDKLGFRKQRCLKLQSCLLKLDNATHRYVEVTYGFVYRVT